MTRHNGCAIRALREARGLSVQDLCDKITAGGRPLSAPALRNIELEHREARVDLVQRIAHVLEVPVRAITRVPLTEWGQQAGGVMTVVNHETGEIVELLDRGEAERLTMRISLKLDAMADAYAGVMPLIREAIERQAHAALGYRSVGEYVMERFGGALSKLGVESRREVVKELTAAGMSTRAIAPVVGVSHMSVKRDLESGVTPVTPEPESDFAERDEHHPCDGARAQDRTPCTPIVGIDGKRYSRPWPPPLPTTAEAVAEFPDLAHHAEIDPERARLMAQDLRRYRESGELEQRLDALRRAVCVDKAKRDGTYRDGTTAVMGSDGAYRMEPLPTAEPVQTTIPCPTCSGRGVIKEQA